MTKRKTKAEETAELVAAAVGAGRKLKLPSVDFSDPNRPKTCLEVDFPILPINQIAQIEGNGGKPIYQMSKWWARRRSSVFRAMLIAAATKAPDDPLEAAKTVWDAYYANHQDNEAFRDLKVADIFMGGGTTLVEGSRLGMQMFGNDLNPVAWFVVKNELADVDLDEVEKLFDHIEREVKPQIMPFYACEGPGGERGTWTHLPGGEVMGEDFDPLALSPEERKDYGYEGPEVIYTFWAKHGPCSAPGCGHRTPLFTSLVIAVKTLSVKTWADFECRECRECRESFDVERAAARMAPYVPLVAADSEVPFAVMGAEGRFACPHCGKEHRDEVALEKGCWKAHELPLSESAASLTSAKIYLLPHQVVLTHRVATASPRRFLIADEVGLGKTIETALILRELASRGELRRALMVVPAGLVNNWHRELNEVFNLDFEVFGREGDVSDRRSNAFEKHDRLIASIDTLKRPARVKRLLEAPPWDLVVFDEAHHMTAYRSGSKVKKTENYKLGEALRDHARDLLLLSATPHQGDHFRFFKLIQLLDPTLFEDANEMVEHRHRLNPVVFRRTKADACRADGSTLFARRWVHTESFVMSDVERQFYLALNEYLRDGFALAKQQGGKGRALGFVMTIFQKIAASSFAAVHRTLRRRLVALSVQEGLVCDANLDIDGREAAFREARALIRTEWGLGNERMDDLELDRILTDLKRRLLKKMDEEQLALASDAFSEELETAAAEDAAMSAVAYALPEERARIKALLDLFPEITETKVDKLLGALGVLWRENPKERVVVFATYLGTVEMLGAEIERRYPGQGVVVLKGGDHGSKLAAERRFKRADGPRVLIATAAGREGINLQHARVLFNFDLPWNPMDVEQRIGRIHRYGQRDTGQVYNLVLGDTIEGRIYLLLDDKLADIAKTLGKVDEHGNVAEDLRGQILGQLSERINYQTLYSAALQDPELKRTQLELDAAMSNAAEARDVVFELFQDLDRFSLDDYAPLAGTDDAMAELTRFLHRAAEAEGWTFEALGDARYRLTTTDDSEDTLFSTQREEANADESLSLLGLDHPIVDRLLGKYRTLEPEEIGVSIGAQDGRTGALGFWAVDWVGEKGQTRRVLLRLAVDTTHQRIPAWERQPEDLLFAEPANPAAQPDGMLEASEAVLERELRHRGLIRDHQTYSGRLVGWVSVG